MGYPRRMRLARPLAAALLVTACSSTYDPLQPDGSMRIDSGGGATDTGATEDAATGIDAGADTGGSPVDAGGGGDANDHDASDASDASGSDVGVADAGACVASGTCDPFDPTSCGTMACHPGATGTRCETVSATAVGEGATCASSSECQPGLVCLMFTAAEGFRCHSMCHARSIGECSAGRACTGTLGDPCIDVCRPMPAACDVYAQDCASATDTCTLVRNPETNAPYTGCRPAGTQNLGDPCGGTSGTCGHALICVSTSGMARCRHVCDPAMGAAMCSGTDVCTGLATTWGVHYCEAP